MLIILAVIVLGFFTFLNYRKKQDGPWNNVANKFKNGWTLTKTNKPGL